MKKKVVKKKVVKKTKSKQVNSKSKSARVGSGVPHFDALIQGGFERKSVNLVVGNSGSGKSIFAMQFLINGLKNGEKCLYVTFEEKKEAVYSNMAEFGWDLASFEEKGLFTFLQYTPEKVKLMLEEGGGAIENIILNKKISLLVIDSITSFALLFDDELQKREAALSLFNAISKWDCTSLLTSEESPFRDGQLASRTLEFEAHSIILIYYVPSKTGRERYLEVLKMRGTNHSTRIYKFVIGKKGIDLSSKPIVPPESLREKLI